MGKVENYLAFGRGLNRGISALANDVGDVPQRSPGNAGEGVTAIIGKVPVNVPWTAEVVRSFDQHGRGSECFECDDEMCEKKFGLQVYLDGNVFVAIDGLPPWWALPLSNPASMQNKSLARLIAM